MERERLDRFRRRQAQRRRRLYILIAALVVIAIVIIAVVIQSQPAIIYPARTPPAGSISDVPILGSGQLAMHIHVHLDIFINGTLANPPADFGHLPDGRLYALHRHPDDQFVHVESEVLQTFTLGEIFEIWGWPLDGNHIFDQNGPVTLYVNGAQTAFDTKLSLHCIQEIVLVYGTPPSYIPSTFNWISGWTLQSCA